MNRKLMTLWLGIPAAFAFGAGAALGDREAAAAALEKTIAVIDLDKAHQAFPLWIERRGQLEAMNDRFRKKEIDLKKAADAKAHACEEYEKGSQEYDQRKFEAQMAYTHWEEQAKLYVQWINKAQAEYHLEVRKKLREEIARFAEQKGYRLVLRKRKNDGNRLRDQIESNLIEDVIYTADALDVTKQVIAFLQANPAPKTGR